MKKKDIRVLTVGVGSIGKRHIDNFKNYTKNIDIVEPLGTETQLFITINNKEIISRMYNPYEINLGQELTFQVDPNKVHFFDKETEKSIV